MAVQVVKCSDCGMRYNATEYSRCPYCAQSNGAEKRWGRKIPKVALDSDEQTSPAPQAVPTEDSVLPNTPAVQPDSPPKPTPVSETQQKLPSLGSRTQSFYAISVPDPFDTFPEKRAVNTTEPKAEESPTPEPTYAPQNPSMSSSIQKLGKTTAKYISSDNGSSTKPAVGWLVCVKGVYFGQTFPLKNGVNKIGRSPEMDVALLQDDSVSRSVAMKLAYDSRANEFNALPGESGEMCYISGNAMYERIQLNGYEEIEFGDMGLNKFVFVPLCGTQFRWENYSAQN